eukprot:222430-Amphidinium_carterae.1
MCSKSSCVISLCLSVCRLIIFIIDVPLQTSAGLIPESSKVSLPSRSKFVKRLTSTFNIGNELSP